MITKHLFYVTIFNLVFIVNARNSAVNISHIDRILYNETFKSKFI